MESILNYISEAASEVKKIVWPKREEIVRLTALVIVISFIAATYIGALDFSFTKLLEVLVAR